LQLGRVAAEKRFYNPGNTQDALEARVTISARYDGVLNLTERDAFDFVLDELLEFPYRRDTVRLALLASLKKQGNLFTDYVVGWAFHVGLEGVVFPSARALELFRHAFDVSVLEGSQFGTYWTSMADAWDYSQIEVIEKEVRRAATKFLNSVFFNGGSLIRKAERFSIHEPNGEFTSAESPFCGMSDSRLRAHLALPDSTSLVRESLSRMDDLQASVDDVCDQLRSKLKSCHSHQSFGEWFEENMMWGL
jgi:hypothetical protein